MSKSMKYSIIQVICWLIVSLGIITIFSLPGTLSNWGDNRLKSLALAFLFFVGYGADMGIMVLSKSKRYGFERDERDKDVQLKAMSSGLMCLVIYIFVLSITLYVIYEKQGLIPIGWVWFIAYTAIVCANLSTGIASLYFYRKMGC